MVHDVRIELVDTAVAAIAIGDVLPDHGAVMPNGSVVLRSSDQTLPCIWIRRQVLDFADSEPFIQRLPGRSAVPDR